MTSLVPNRFLFKFEFPLQRAPKALLINGTLEGWAEKYKLPPLFRIDGENGFADVYAAWNEAGLYIGCRVTGKRAPLHVEPAQFWKSDNVRVMTDMRDTRNIRRATRFCQQFFLLPAGGGKGGKQAMAGGAAIHRATEDGPVAAPGDISIASHVEKTGYSLTAHLPGWLLSGFDPVEHRRIGLLVMVEDRELGQQSLTVGDELNWFVDPSTWPTAVMVE